MSRLNAHIFGDLDVDHLFTSFFNTPRNQAIVDNLVSRGLVIPPEELYHQ